MKDGESTPWRPGGSTEGLPGDADYFSEVLVYLDQYLSDESTDWKVYFTWSSMELPEYGEHVVAVVLGDEYCRVPRYANKVGAIFKGYGTFPHYGGTLFPSRINVSRLANYVRMLSKNAHSRLRASIASPGSARAPIHSIPLGYYKQQKRSVKAFEERETDVFFAGSIGIRNLPFFSLKRWVRRPKGLSRLQMLAEAERARKKHPAWAFHIEAVERGENFPLSAEEYSAALMNSKICLVPRGNSIETFRFFEALCYGCIVITEPMPKRWFYTGAPVHELGSWHELDSALTHFLSSPERMKRLHLKAMKWWDTMCSEQAVGKFMAAKLREAKA